MGVSLDEEVVRLIESGAVAIWLATCDANAKPEATRIMGTRVAKDRRALSLHVPIDQAGATFTNLAVNERLGVFYCRVTDYKAVQIKGSLLDMRPSGPSERELQARYSRTFAETCSTVRVPFETMLKLRFWPSMTVDMRVEEVFVQTPGPQAGMPWR